MIKPLIITVAGGPPAYSQQSLVTLKSFHENVRPAGVEMVWLTNDMPPEGVERCKKYGTEAVFVRADFQDYGNRQRHWHMLQWLCKNQDRKYTHVLTIDARDLLFLDNPFTFPAVMEEGAICSAEASSYRDCPWNSGDASRMMGSLHKPFRTYDSSWSVINGGHVAGPFRDVIWAEMARFAIDCRGGGATDQATLGFLTHWTKDWNTLFKVVNVSEPWICHGHFWRNFEKQVTVDGYKVFNTKGELYRMLHQHDRASVPESLRKAIMEKYGVE